MYELAGFSWKDMTDCGAKLRSCGANAKSMEDVASTIVRLLHNELIDGGPDKKATTLVRLYKTHPYTDLPAPLHKFATTLLEKMQHHEPPPNLKCLTLVGSAGEKTAWNGRAGSEGHKAIPLPSPSVVEAL